MKLDIIIPPITHGAPDAEQFRVVMGIGNEFLYSMFALLHDKCIQPLSIVLHQQTLQHSADQMQMLVYGNKIVALMYIHSTDYHYLNSYHFVQTHHVRSLIGDMTVKSPKGFFLSPDAFITHLTSVVRYQSGNQRIDLDRYERNINETEGKIIKLTCMDKIIGIIHQTTENHYFISNEGIQQAKKRLSTLKN